MIGATAKAEQFHTRSGNESTKGSRKGFGLLGGGIDPSTLLTGDQKLMARRSALIAQMASVDVKIAREKAVIKFEAPFKGRLFHAAVERRNVLQAERSVIMAEILEIKQALGTMHGVLVFEKHFVDVCRERLTAAQFHSIKREAFDRARDAAAEQGEKP